MTLKTAVITFAFVIIFASPALAVNSTTSGKIPALKQKVEEKKENRIEKIENKIASREGILKEKLAQFKDRKKAEITQRINNELNKINQKRTEEMLKHLGKMTIILEKLEAKTNTKHDDVRTIIASTSAAVNAQAQKDYTITVTSETRVKADAQKIRLQLQADLQALRKKIIDAKQSLSYAIKIANLGKDKPKEATPNGRE